MSSLHTVAVTTGQAEMSGGPLVTAALHAFLCTYCCADCQGRIDGNTVREDGVTEWLCLHAPQCPVLTGACSDRMALDAAADAARAAYAARGGAL